MKNKQFKTALDYYDYHLIMLNYDFDSTDMTVHEYLEKKQKLYYKSKLYERKQILKASFVSYWQGKSSINGEDLKYKGGQDYYNKTYGYLESDGSNRKIKFKKQ